jgi:hypothetical protein
MAAESHNCISCNLTFLSARALSIHRSASSAHNNPLRQRVVWSRRAKKRPQSEAFDEVEAAEAQDRDDVQGSEASSAQDHDEDMYPEADVSTSADLDAFWSMDGSVDRFNLWAHTPLETYVADSPIAGLVNQFPLWAPWDQAAYSLALTGPVPPVDLVSSGQLTKEESQLTVSGQCKGARRTSHHMKKIVEDNDTASAQQYSATTNTVR